MQRRKFLAGMGSLAAGGAAAMGTGAFTSVAAERSVSVNVAGDQSAYLGLKPGDSPHAYTEGGELKFKFNGDRVSGSGINTDAFTKFNDLFKIQNNGGQTCTVWLDEGFSETPDVNNGNAATFGKNLPKGAKPWAFFWSFAQYPDGYEARTGKNKAGSSSDTLGNPIEYGIDDSQVLAPTNINTDYNSSIFNRTRQHPAVLTPGDSISINFQINTGDDHSIDMDPTDLTDVSGTVVLNAFSHDFAVDLQS